MGRLRPPFTFPVCYTTAALILDWSSLDAYRYCEMVQTASSSLRAAARNVFVHISAFERAGLSGLNEGQAIEYEEVSNRGKTSAENLSVRALIGPSVRALNENGGRKRGRLRPPFCVFKDAVRREGRVRDVSKPLRPGQGLVDFLETAQ